MDVDDLYQISYSSQVTENVTLRQLYTYIHILF